METPLISPSVLSANFLKLGEEITKIEKAGADWHHLDVMDGHFVPNLSFGPPLVRVIKSISTIPLDVHLMITNPDEMAVEYAKAGADLVTFHIEASKNPHQTINSLKASGKKVGISLNPDTEVEKLKGILHNIDLILLMSVHPGFSGQKFILNSFLKLKSLTELLKRENLREKIKISVDGGVDQTNAKELSHCGANILVSGSYIYKGSNYKTQIQSLR